MKVFLLAIVCLAFGINENYAQGGADGLGGGKTAAPKTSAPKKAGKSIIAPPKKFAIVSSKPKPQSSSQSSVANKAARAQALAKQSLDELVKGNYSSAKNMAANALQLNTDLSLALAVSGWAKSILGNTQSDYQAAATDLEKAVRLEPSNGLFHARLGRVYKQLNRNSDAEAELNKGLLWLELPAGAIEYYARGLCKDQLNKLNEAIADYDKAISLNPQFAIAYYNRGVLYNAKNDHDAAIRDYNRALEINSQYANAYYSRANSYRYQKKDYDAAIRDYTRAIEIRSQYANAYVNRGVSYYEKRDYDAAIKDYTRALEINPQDASTYNNRAFCYDAKGQKDLAEADRKKYKELGGK